MEKRIEREREAVQGEKLGLWELRNEIMELEEAIRQGEQEEEEAEEEDSADGEYYDDEEDRNEPQTLKDMLRRWQIEKEG